MSTNSQAPRGANGYLSWLEEHIFLYRPRTLAGIFLSGAEPAAPLGALPSFAPVIYLLFACCHSRATHSSPREDAPGVEKADPARSGCLWRTPRPQPMGWARVREVKVQARGLRLAPPLPSPPSQPAPPATLQTQPCYQGLPWWHVVCWWVVIKHIYLQFLSLAHHPRPDMAPNTAGFVRLAAAGAGRGLLLYAKRLQKKLKYNNRKTGFPQPREMLKGQTANE